MTTKTEKNDKTVSARIKESTWEWLVKIGGTAGGAIKEIIDQAERVDAQGSAVFTIADNLAYLQQIRRYSLNEIKGVFTPAEWCYMTDSLNGTMITVDFRCSTSALSASIEDSDTFDGLGEKWDVNVLELLQKISKLTGAQVECVFNRVEEFWNSPGFEKDLSKWAIW